MIKKNIKTMFALLLVFVMAAVVVGCGNSGGDTDQNSNPQLSEQPEDNLEDAEQKTDTTDDNVESQEKDSSDNGKILIAYFSHSGNTKKLPKKSRVKQEGSFLKFVL